MTAEVAGEILRDASGDFRDVDVGVPSSSDRLS